MVAPLGRWLKEQMEEEEMFDAVVVSDTPIGPLASSALIDALASSYPSLLHLVLLRTDGGDLGGIAAASLLASSASLNSLELVDQGLTGAVGEHLGAGLQTNTSLKVLNLDYNPLLGSQGLASLSRGFSWNESLSSLSLQFCGLDERAGPVLASGILPFGSLTSLDLYGNRLGVKGVHALLKGVPEATNLQSLNLGDNGAHNPHSKVARRMVDAMHRTPSLTSLDFSGHLLDDPVARILHAGLETAPHIVSFPLTDRMDHDLILAFKSLEKAHAKARRKRRRPKKKKKT